MRVVYSCRSFEKELENLSVSEESIDIKIDEIRKGSDGIRGETKGRKSRRRKYFKVELPGRNRLLYDRQENEIYLLFVGDHVSYDLRWQGKEDLPSIDGTKWVEWKDTEDSEAPATPDEERQHVHDEYEQPPPFGTKSILDNIVGLTTSQTAILQMKANGPVLIRGVAGSGKTALGLHRARHISKLRARLGEDTSILILTRTQALKTAIGWLYANGFAEDLPNDVEISAFGDWMAERLQKRGLTVSANQNSRKGIKQIQAKVAATHPHGKALRKMSSSFLISEIDDVIRGREIGSLEQYNRLKRTGRRTGLNQMRRELVWIVYQQYQSALREQDMFDWLNCPSLS